MKTDPTILPVEHTMVPFAHQLEAFELSKDRPMFALLMEMGTAKSKIVLDTAQHLYHNHEIDGLMIIAPKGAYMNWIDNELPAHLPKSLPVRIGWYNADMGIRHERKIWKITDAKDDVLDIVCINVEAMATVKGRGFAYRFAKNHYAMMVVDESQVIKNPKAVRTEKTTEIGRMCNYRRILSGTPITKNPLDLYSQFHFLFPGLLGFLTFTEFKNYFAEYYIHSEGRIRYEVITKFKNLEELTERLKQHSYRKLKSECLDLPEKLFETRYVEQTEEQRTAYKIFKEQAILELENETVLTSTSVLRTMIKLHQINCGHIKDDDGNMHYLPHNRILELMEIVEDIPGKVIVWAAFKEDIHAILLALKKQYGEEAAVDFYGDTTAEDRRKNEWAFKNNPACKFFVATPDTAGRSLTLVEAAYAIYYSYRDNLEHWLQSQDRNHRPGQKNIATYITMVIRGTIDVKIMKALLAKKDLASLVLDNWRALLNDEEDSMELGLD